MATTEAEASKPGDVKAEGDAGGDQRKATPRTRVGEGRCVGVVVEWRGYMGWIQPLMRIKHEMAAKHQGRVYLNLEDVATVGDRKERVKEGKIVDFLVYADSFGVGAEECRPRHVIRLTIPHKEAHGLLKHSSQWSEYLTDSEYYPTVERDYGVLLRKYAWELNFAALELWGHFDELAVAAVELAMKAHAEGKKIDEEREKKAAAASEAEPKEDASPSVDTATADAPPPVDKPTADTDLCHLRLLVYDSEVAAVEKALPNAKILSQPVIPFPLNCYTCSIDATKKEAIEAVRQFAVVMAGPKPEPQTAKSPEQKGKGKGKGNYGGKAHGGKGGGRGTWDYDAEWYAEAAWWDEAAWWADAGWGSEGKSKGEAKSKSSPKAKAKAKAKYKEKKPKVGS